MDQSADLARKGNEAQFRLLIGQLPGILWTTDPQLRITSSSGAGLADVGLTPGESDGVLLSDLLRSDDPHNPALKAHRQALQGERASFHNPFRGREYQCAVVPSWNGRGELCGVMGVAVDITAQLRMEQDRERSLSLLRATLESTTDGMLVVDRQGKVSLFNGQFAQMWRIPPYLLEARDDGRMLEFVLSQLKDPERFLTKVREAYLYPEAERFECLEFKDGRTFERYSKPQKIGNEVVGRLWSFRDVTQQRSAESAQRRVQAQLQAVIDGSPAMIYVKDLEGRYLLMNRRLQKVMGLSGTEIQGKTDYDLFPSHQAEVFRANDERVLQTLQQTELEEEAQQEDGPHTYLSLKFPLLDGEGRPYAVCGVSTDITARRHLEDHRIRMVEEQHRLLARLRRRTAELQAVLDNMTEGVWACDENRRLFLINKAGLRSMNLDEEAIGLSVDQALGALRTGESGQELPIVRASQGETVLSADLTFQGPQFKRPIYFRSNATPIRDESGRITAAVAVTRDITPEMELEHLKEQFMKVAAHELKTPVSVMKAFAQLALRQGKELSTELRKTLESIDRGASRIDQIVGSILDVSQLHVGQVELSQEELDLIPLAEEAVRGVKKAPGRVRILAQSPVTILGDRKRLSQVLSSLVDNALRYSPEGTPVTVSIHSDGQVVQLAVEDQGIGIPAERQGRIFERFFRAHSGTPHDYGGLGVSLHLARATVAMHGGTVSFTSTEGEGTRFLVSLPALESKKEVSRSPSAGPWPSAPGEALG